MAPAIVHFLVGATLVLVLAIPVGLRSPLPVWGPLWLVAIGGLWGLGPDIHHLEPLVGGPVHALHDSPWADCWAFHYTLDRPLVRANYLASVAGAIACFLGAVGAFTLAVWLGARPAGPAPVVHRLAGALAGLVVVGLVTATAGHLLA